MDRGIVGAIYWKLHAAYLRNERGTADTMLGMLLDEGKRVPLKDALGAHFDRFERIRDSMSAGYYGRLYGYGEPTPCLDPYAQKDASGEEAEFHRKIMTRDGRKALFDCLGIGPAATMLHEVQMDPYGRCDFLVREGREWHCIELKMGQPSHSVCSQIDKYRLSSELDMSLGMHDKVSATVVAEGFSHYVAGELSRLAVTMVTHSGEPGTLKRI